MNNDSAPNPLIQIISEETTQSETLIACLALLGYASLLHLSDEVEYIWRRKFTLPTLLYVLSKYPVFPYLSIAVAQVLLPDSVPDSVFNALGFLSQSLEVLPFIGVQGLISIRAYALCQGYRPVTIVLALLFLTALGSQIYVVTIINSVSEGPLFIPGLLNNVCIILSDVIAFIVVIRQVWGLWKLKQSSGMQSNKDLVTALFHQGILRFSFVLFITITASILADTLNFAGSILFAFQNVLSTLLICEFTLAVRKRNYSKYTDFDQSTLSTPAFQANPARSFRVVFGNIHENIVTEMGERNDLDTELSALETDDYDFQASSYEMSPH